MARMISPDQYSYEMSRDVMGIKVLRAAGWPRLRRRRRLPGRFPEVPHYPLHL